MYRATLVWSGVGPGVPEFPLYIWNCISKCFVVGIASHYSSISSLSECAASLLQSVLRFRSGMWNAKESLSGMMSDGQRG